MHRRETIQRKENGVTEVEEKRKKKKNTGAKSSLLFFSCLLKPFFKGVCIYILLLPARVSSNIYYMLQWEPLPPVVSHQGVVIWWIYVLQRTPPVLSLSLSRSLFRTLFTRVLYFSCVKKAFPFSPGFHCLWLAVKEERSLAPSAPLHPNPVHSGIHRGPCRGRRWGEGSLSSPFYPVSSHVFLFLSIPRRAVIHISY